MARQLRPGGRTEPLPGTRTQGRARTRKVLALLRGRGGSVRSRIVLLLVPPVTALVVLWGVAATTSLQDSLRQTRARTFTQKVLEPTDQVIGALQDERRMSLSALGDDATIGRAGFEAQREATDRARNRFRASMADEDTGSATRPETRERMARLARSLAGLQALRVSVDARTVSRSETLSRYTEYIELAFDVYDEVHSMDPELVRQQRILRTLDRARENLAREDALVTGALAAGRMNREEYLQLVQAAGAHRFLYSDAARSMPISDRSRYEQIVEGDHYQRFEEIQNRLMNAGVTDTRPPVDIGAWHTSTEAVDGQLAALSNSIRVENTQRARDEANAVLLRLGLTGGLGLLAVVAAVLIAARAAHRLIVESREMASTVTAFARLLPLISERARRGEQIPVEDDPALPVQAHPVQAQAHPVQAQAHPVQAPGAQAAGAVPHGAAFAGASPGGRPDRFRVTEVAQIDRAFAEARRAVVRAAESEARAHRRLNELFVTLARRNQSLLQRLLRQLEGMQRSTEDPDELQRLFELDSLATRMRRHAEGLVILSGRPSGRTWRDPVLMVDVARAAASEVEDYERVEVVPMGRTALLGPAVADTIHLMAELIENAASFSPPNTPIRVTGQEVSNGFALEVEDRGLGITPGSLVELNRLLSTDPELNLDDTARLGLFVVARLASRHGINVTLRPSPYGGIIAIALIPRELVVDPPERTAQPVPGGAHAVVQGGVESSPGQGRALVVPGVPADSGPGAEPGATGPPANDGADNSDTVTTLRDATGWSPGRTVFSELPAGVAPFPGDRNVPEGDGPGDTNGPGSVNGHAVDDELWGTPEQSTGPIRAIGPEHPAVSEPPEGAEPSESQETGFAQGAGTGDSAGNGRDGEHPQGGTAPGAPGEWFPLPVRRRQANLAPQLRNQPDEGRASTEWKAPATRSPEAARDLMSMMQRGWEQGRTAEPPERPEPPARTHFDRSADWFGGYALPRRSEEDDEAAHGGRPGTADRDPGPGGA